MRRVVLLMILCWLSKIQLPAQLHGNYGSITVNDGLAQNTVWDVVEDHRGYLWIATADGLNRFDGYHYKHYKHNPSDSTTIAGITILGFFIDSQQTLWVIHDRGVSVYDRVHDRFRNIIKINSYMIGETGGFIWLFERDSRVLKLDLDGKIVEEFPFTGGTSLFGSIPKPVSIGDLLYINSKFGLLKIDPTSNEVKYLDKPKDFQGAMIVWNDSTLFCPGHSSYLFNIRSNSFNKIDLGFDLPNTFLSTSLLYYQDQYLMGSAEGLYVIDPMALKVKRHIRSFERGKESSFHYVQCLYVDGSGNLFIGTNGDGMKVYVPARNKFPLYSTGETSLDFTKTIAKIGDQLISGLFQHGIVVFESFAAFTHLEFMNGLKTSSVLAVFPFDKDRLLLVNRNDLVLYNLSRQEEEKRVLLEHGISQMEVGYPVIKSGGVNRWFVNSDGSVFSVDRQFNLKKLIDLYVFEKIQISTHTLVGDRFWVGTQRGLFLFDTIKYEVSGRLLTDYYIKCITEASNGHVWIATTGGLFEFEGLNQINKHDVSTGLPNDFVYGVLEDKYGFIWISHNKGLSRINPNDNSYQHFGLEDGLQANEFNTGAFFKDDEGFLYFGGVGGINKIDPEKLTDEVIHSQIAINQIYVLDELLDSDTAYNEMKSLRLSYKQNTLSFDFAALNFLATDGAKYSYKLEGYDPNWITSGDRHFARYANLPPGDYIFQMQASINDSPWGENVRMLPIHIAAPFWQKAWFYTLIVLLGLGILMLVGWLIIKLQGRRLKRELEVQQKLEMERLRISRDLHDNVGAQLSYLITNMEWIADHPETLDTDQKREQLRQLSDTGRQAITTLRQTIWAISQSEIFVEEFVDRFKQFALKMVEFLPHVRLHFREEISATIRIEPEVALNLFRICQESFNNAVKHSQATEFSIAFISTSELPFGFELEDNGVGFDLESAKYGSYGLKNMKARAKESHANLTLTSAHGKGTTIRLEWTGKLNNAFAV